MARLESALALYVEWSAAGRPGGADRLLAGHPELTDLLAAMLADRGGGAGDPAPAHQIGDFRILSELGRGGMGVVYRARQLSLDREVALKVLPAHLTLQPSSVARFRREAATAARLEHPGIVQIHAVGDDGDTHYFAMEMIEGAPLARVDPQSRRQRSVRELVEIVAAVADALEHAHRHGVIHRDVKPANILVRPDGRPVVTDFGLARDLDLPGLSLSGGFTGTAWYVSPEQANGSKQIDARADLFALGATLYELLTGRRPFDGDTVQQVLVAIARTDPIDPLRLVRDLSPDLAAIVSKTLEKDPARRYQTAAELAADLRAFLEYRPVRARRASPLARLRRWVRREPLRAALLLVVAIAVPVVSAAIGYLVANADVLRVGAERIAQQRLEQQLARVTVDYEAGDFAAALAGADAALALAPDNIEALALRAITLFALGRAEDALSDLDRAAGDRPGSTALQWARAWVLSVLDRETEARALEATLGEPRDAVESYLAASIEAQRLQREGAGAGDWRRVRERFARAMHLSPAPRQHFHVRWTDATCLTGDQQAIDDCVATLRALWPDSPAALLYVGFALRRTDPAAAIASYERVLAAGYDHPRIHASIASCHEALGDFEAARAALARSIAGYQAMDHEGRLAAAQLTNYAQTLERTGDRDAAMVVAERAVRAAPKLANAHLTLGWLRRQRGDLQRAIESYRAAAELRPKDGDAIEPLGVLLYKTGQLEQAVTRLRTLVALRPESGIAQHLLGNALLGAGHLEAAIEANRRAVLLEPERPEFAFNLGYALARAGEHGAAAVEFGRATELRHDYARAFWQLAISSMRSGARDAAVRAQRRAVELDPEHARSWLEWAQALHVAGAGEGMHAALAQAAEHARPEPGLAGFLCEIAALQVESGAPAAARATLLRGLGFATSPGERTELQAALDRLPPR